MIVLFQIQIKMGQAMQACCNPTPGGHEVEINPFDKNILDLNVSGFRPCSSMKVRDEGIQQTMRYAEQFRRQTGEGWPSQQLWMMEVKGNDDKVRQIYCKGNIVDGQMHGQVLLYFPQGEMFRGTIVHKQPAQGIFVYKKGCFYCGAISNYNSEGYGRYQNNQGYIYEGNWSKSLPYGKGVQTYRNGDTYEGELTYGQKFGQGIYRFADGKVYQGSFYMNKSDGRGKMTYPNKDQYEGQWKLGNYHGKGKFTWKNGQTYEGQYHEGIRQGKGKYTFKNGSWYQGGWQNGKQSGHGTFHEGYDEIGGNWVNGLLLN